MIFSWNRANKEHIAKHGVKPAEAEQVVRGARSPWPTKSEDEKARDLEDDEKKQFRKRRRST